MPSLAMQLPKHSRRAVPVDQPTLSKRRAVRRCARCCKAPTPCSACTLSTITRGTRASRKKRVYVSPPSSGAEWGTTTIPGTVAGAGALDLRKMSELAADSALTSSPPERLVIAPASPTRRGSRRHDQCRVRHRWPVVVVVVVVVVDVVVVAAWSSSWSWLSSGQRVVVGVEAWWRRRRRGGVVW